MTAEWDVMALVGRIARTHGVRGQLIVNPDTDFPEHRYREDNVLYVQREGKLEPLTITAVRFHQGRPLLSFRGVETIGEAERLIALELRVPADALVSLPVGTFYRHELVGCVVTTATGESVGPVVDVQGPSNGSRLVVRRGAEDVLIPLATEICVRIDSTARAIVIDPPEGLLDLNVTRRTRSRA